MNKLLADFNKKPIVPTATVNGVMGVQDDEEEYSTTSDSDDEPYEHYEQEYVNKEMQRYAKCNAEPKSNKYSSMSEIEGVDGMNFQNNPLNVYSCYNFSPSVVKRELPIDSFKEKILQLIAVNSVVIIQGPTGCGKTTQVPQFILDQSRENNEYCNIVVTQPRKIATITVARRVCEERGWTLGTICGYQVGLEKKVHPDMILTYMTTGVLLQKLIYSQSLQQFTHIIIDEVHERNEDLDFLLLIVRKFLFTTNANTKVILMSATIEAEEYAYYFRTPSLSHAIPAPVIFVDKNSSYKNKTYYLEDLKTAIANTKCTYTLDPDKPDIGEGIWKLFTFLVNVMDKLDEVNPVTNQTIIGSILVFLPGIHEIEEANRRLLKENAEAEVKKKWQIVPLHSSLPNDEQAAAFKPPQEGYRKIILSTNIAESSVTVPDSYYVIDFCQTKVLTVDPITKFLSLKLEWASHVNCEQRAGRVGRVGNGRVYRLVEKKFYFEKMPRRSLPEILRAPLERVVLLAKKLNLRDTPQQILALALNPPNIKNIELTILNLKECGGLLQTCNNKPSNCDGDLTFLGEVMCALPLDVRLSKMILLGHLFGCLEDAIVMAAGSSIQNIFSTPFQQRFSAYKKLLLWADGSLSDLIALTNLYQLHHAMKRDNHFENYRQEMIWCVQNFLSIKGLREWNLLVIEIKQRLEHLNIKHIPGQLPLKLDERPLILKVIMAGAFYPNFFIREPDQTHDERDAVKAVGGRNPFRTVYLTGLSPEHPQPIYTSAIKELFKNDKNSSIDMAVGFDGSSKIYVEFTAFDKKKEQVTVAINGRQMVTDLIPGKIPNSVYEAVRKRQLKIPFVLQVLPVKEAWEFALQNGISKKSTLQQFKEIDTAGPSTDISELNCYSQQTDFSPVPTLDVEYITLKITEHIDASHFWANTVECEPHLNAIEEILNRTVLRGVLQSGEDVTLRKTYVTKFSEDQLYYRCQVISKQPKKLQVIFIDYGNIQAVNPSDLYILPNYPECNVAPLAIECVLHGIQPSRKMNPKGVWIDRINKRWAAETFGFVLFGEVHSVVDNVVYLELFKHESSVNKHTSINQQMIAEGHAEPAIESFLSKADNEKRLQVRKAENPNREAVRMSFDKVANYSDCKAPNIGSKYKMVELKGPYSPLEMKLHGCVESASNKSVEIEGNSVNSVLLDNDPQDYHNRLLVAGYISQTSEGNKLKLRATTLMPNVPGLATLLALIFCPRMKPKLTDDGTRVASILCGLGYCLFTHKPYLPSHDINLVLDTELTVEDIDKINIIRYQMQYGVDLMYENYRGSANLEQLIKTQVELKKHLTNLIYEYRKPVTRVNVKFANVWTKSNVETLVMKPVNYNADAKSIWPLLSFVKLRSSKDSSSTSKNLEDLDLMARNMVPVGDGIKCDLCDTILYTVVEIRFHIISEKHKNNVSQYYSELSEEDD